MATEHIILWGMTDKELAIQGMTLIAAFIGPLAAVLVTQWLDRRRREKDAQLAVLKDLMGTRHLAGDPRYTSAINLIGVEFANHPKVMAALDEYLKSANRKVPEDEQPELLKETLAQQSNLIKAVMVAVGFESSDDHLKRDAYAAGGLIERDNLWLDAMRAWPQIAAALWMQTRMLQGENVPPTQPKTDTDKQTEPV